MNKLAHVCIETQDLGKTEAFYKLLGLRRRFAFHNKEGELVGFYLAFDDQTFIEVILNRTARAEGIIRHFAIETDDLDKVRRALLEGGVDVSEKELAIDFTWMARCHDPNGIFIELMEYTTESMQRVGGVCEVNYTP
jgi:catechol 2,3-dioxygenase-like lactoylglutathione lyase family enzyme